MVRNEPTAASDSRASFIMSELVTTRVNRAISRDALACGIHPADFTKKRATVVYQQALEYVGSLEEATLHVQRDGGIELRLRSPQGEAVVSIEPTVEPEFEVTIYSPTTAVKDVRFDRAAKAVAYIAAHLR